MCVCVSHVRRNINFLVRIKYLSQFSFENFTPFSRDTIFFRTHKKLLFLCILLMYFLSDHIIIFLLIIELVVTIIHERMSLLDLAYIQYFWRITNFFVNVVRMNGIRSQRFLNDELRVVIVVYRTYDENRRCLICYGRFSLNEKSRIVGTTLRFWVFRIVFDFFAT